jgi:hypothetical protein
MVKKVIGILIFILVSGSFYCQDLKMKSEFGLELTNQELIAQIRLYQKTVKVPSVKNKFVVVYCKKIDKTINEYSLIYCIDVNRLLLDPPQVFFTIDNQLVGFIFEGVDCFALTKSSLISIMQSYLPEDYEYYLKFNDFPPPITARDEIWKLRFKNGKLIEKQVIGN